MNKLLCLIFLSAMLLHAGSAQYPYAMQWQRSMDRLVVGAYDKGESICADGQGNTFLTGRSGSTDHGQGDPSSIWTTKRDQNGEEIWSRKWSIVVGPRDIAAGCRLHRMAGGDVIAYGNVTGQFTGVAVRYDGLTGATVWEYQVPGRAMSGVASDLGGNVYVLTGSTTSRLTKLDPSGSPVWQTDFPLQRTLVTLTLDSTGTPVVAGQKSSQPQAAYVAKVDPLSGIILWASTANRSSDDEWAFSVIIDSANNIYVAGRASPGSNLDYLIAKFGGGNGQNLWTTVVDRMAYDNEARGLLLDEQAGRLFVGGTARVTSSTTGACIMQVNPATGAVVWQAAPQVPDINTSTFAGMTFSSNRDIVVTSSSDHITACRIDASLGTTAWMTTVEPQVGFSMLRCYAICNDANGGVVVAGTALQGTQNGPPHHDDAVWIRLSEATGVVLASQLLDAKISSGDFLTDTLVDSNQNVYLVGVGQDQVIVKYDSDGNELWTQADPYTTLPSGTDVVDTCLTADSSALLAAGTTPSVGGSNAFVTRLNTVDRTVAWTAILNFMPEHEERCSEIALHPDGSVLVTGISDSKIFVTKLDVNTGAQIWTRLIDATYIFSQSAPMMRLDGNGDIVVSSPDGQTTSNNGGVRTLKINGTTGALIWSHFKGSVGGPQILVRGLALDSSGNPIIATTSTTLPSYNTIPYVFKLNGQTGSLVWDRSLSGIMAEDVLIDSGGNSFVLGLSNVSNVQTLTFYRLDALGSLTNTHLYSGPYVNFADTPFGLAQSVDGRILALAAVDTNTGPIAQGVVLELNPLTGAPALQYSLPVNPNPVYSRDILRMCFASPNIIILGMGHGDLSAIRLARRTTLHGNAALQGWVGPLNGHEAWIDLVSVATGTPSEYATTLAGTGDFSVSVAERGDYDVYIRVPLFLRVFVARWHLSGNDQTIDSRTLLAGDCNSDNSVDIGDYSILSLAFNSFPGDPNWDQQADLNGDQAVDLGDYSLLSLNYGASGD